MGDEYFANLDHIESVENFKEGYESEAHCSDSEGSGVDVSKIKIQPSALVSSHPPGRPTKKGERRSLKAPGNVLELRRGRALLCPALTPFFLQQLRARAHRRTATTTTTKNRKVKKRATVPTTRSSRTATTAPALCGGVIPPVGRPKATRKVRAPRACSEEKMSSPVSGAVFPLHSLSTSNIASKICVVFLALIAVSLQEVKTVKMG